MCSYTKVSDWGLYIGDKKTAAERDVLAALGITHVVNVTVEVRDYFAKSKEPVFTYHHAPCLDSDVADLYQHFERSCDFIEEARLGGHPVLVHCQQGVSRSASIVIAYLIRYQSMTLSQAYTHLRRARPECKPKANFLVQLTKWEQSVKRRSATSAAQLLKHEQTAKEHDDRATTAVHAIYKSAPHDPASSSSSATVSTSSTALTSTSTSASTSTTPTPTTPSTPSTTPTPTPSTTPSTSTSTEAGSSSPSALKLKRKASGEAESVGVTPSSPSSVRSPRSSLSVSLPSSSASSSASSSPSAESKLRPTDAKHPGSPSTSTSTSTSTPSTSKRAKVYGVMMPPGPSTPSAPSASAPAPASSIAPAPVKRVRSVGPALPPHLAHLMG